MTRATVILRYPKAPSSVDAFLELAISRNDVELYGATGYAATVGADKLRVRYRGEKAETVVEAPPVSKSRIEFAGLPGRSPARRNQTGMGIRRRWRPMLWWCKFWMPARRSAASGKTITLEKLPD